MLCWNCTVDIKKGENWTPQNKLWIEVNSERPHDFKKCFKANQIKTGKWIKSKSKYEKIGDPIIDDLNKNYYKDLYYFLKNGPPSYGYYAMDWLEK